MVALELPAQATPFVGRTHELTEIASLLDNSECRLVTLIGSGGIGKTRLALEVGKIFRQREESCDSTLDASAFVPDGVYFVALQSLNPADCILTAIAEAIGLQFYVGRDQCDQLIDYCRAKSFLLILDNFEHMIAGLDDVVELLTNAPNLKMLVTSRESLNVREEWLYPVRGMAFPDQEDTADFDLYSAVRLFAQNACRVRPDFSLNDNKRFVLRICQLVEGMPLALEISAGWLRRLPIQEIVLQLERGLDLLENPVRNAPKRHRSIRAVFDHSWSLLSEAEQTVFTKLSVFRGGWRREAAEAVAGASLGILSSLVDKSLLSVDGNARYHLHELVRQYAEEKLRALPEIDHEVHEEYAAYYLNFMAERSTGMMVHMSPIVVGEIGADLKNLRSALDWMLENDAMRLQSYEGDEVYCLLLYYQFRCLYEDGENLAERVAAILRRQPLSEALAEILTFQGWFAELRSQDYTRAIALLEESGHIHDVLHSAHQSENLLRLSDVAVQMGDYERARQLAQESVHCKETESSEKWFLTFDLAQLGYVTYLLGDYPKARELLQEAIQIAEHHEVRSGVSDARNYLGRVELALHAYQEAKRIFVENVAYSKQNVYLKGTVLALIGAGEANVWLGDFKEARLYLCEALTTALESNQIPYVLDALSTVASLLTEINRPEQAAGILGFVLNHRATTHGTRSQAASLRAQLEAQCPAKVISAAFERTRTSTVEDVVCGVLDNELSESLALNSTPGAFDSASPLTSRELEILGLAANGLSNREIAAQLYLSAGTVKWYLSEIYAKLYVASRTQAIARARELHLLN